jgi:hypothetical protein
MGAEWIKERIRAGDLPARKVPTKTTFRYAVLYDELDCLMDSYLVRPSEIGKLADELVEDL